MALLVFHVDFSLGRIQTGIDWSSFMGLSYSKTSVFFHPHENGKPAFSKNSTLETIFVTSMFDAQCGRKAKMEKHLHFKIISGYVWMGPKGVKT